MMRSTLTIGALIVLLLTGCSASKELANKSHKQEQVHYDMGVDALRKGNLPIAFRELLKAQSFQPDSAKIKATLALAWRYRGDLHKSAQLYRQALLTQPTSAMHNNYGNLLLQMGDLANAEKQFRLALTDPSYIRQDMALINLGDVLTAQGEFDQAIKSYRQAGRINPNQNISQLREAEAFISSHRKPYAEALLLTMLRQQPDDLAALKAILPLLQQNHNRSQATALLHHFLTANQDPNASQWVEQQMHVVEQWHE